MNQNNSSPNFLSIAITLMSIAGLWKTFEKAGEPGWKALIPFYNIYTLCNIAGARSMFIYELISTFGIIGSAIYMLFATFAMFGMGGSASLHFVISILLFLFFLVLTLFVSWTINKKLANSFNLSTAFAVGLTLVNPIFILILGFTGNILYVGPNGIPADESDIY